MDCDIDDDTWDPRNDFETVNGMPVYYGGNFDDSDCEDPRDLAYEDWLDWYNFNALKGCCVDLPGKGNDQLPNALDSAVMMVGAAAQPAYVQQDLLATSVPMMDIEITVPVGNIPMTWNDTPIAAESADPRTPCATGNRMPVYFEWEFNDSDYETPGDNDYATANPRNNSETVNGMPVYYGGDLNDSDYESPGDNDYDTWEDWCDSDIRDRYCGLLPDDEESQLPVIFGESNVIGGDVPGIW